MRAIFHLWSGRVHRHYGIRSGDPREFQSAVESYARAIKLNPEMGVAFLERGILLWRELTRATHAIRDLSMALGLRPEWPEALFNRAMAYQAAGNYTAAAEDLTAYLALPGGGWRDEASRQLAMIQALLDGKPQAQDGYHDD
jgi:tetratricopeptide (TPR) repeat protein